jgi:hypothetical protein
MVSISLIRRPAWRLLGVLLLALALALANARLVSAYQVVFSPTDPGEELPAADTILQLRLQVMPEFDDPRVLVIGQGRLAGDAGASWAISFWIPEDAQVNLVTGMHSTEAQLVSQPFTLQPDPDRPGYSLLSTEFDSPHFFYEYYYPGLEGEPGNPHAKSLEFVFSSPNPVENLSLELQQPRGASNFASQPPSASTRHDERHGLSYHQVEAGILTAGQPYSVQVSYTRSDPNPSIVQEDIKESLTMSAIAPLGKNDAGLLSGLGAKRDWVWVVMLLTLGMAIILAAFLQRCHREPGKVIQTRANINVGFCPSCGQAQRPGALYCYRCGSRLENEMK